MWLALLDGMQAVWDDPPSYANELKLERDLVTSLKDPLTERVKILVAEKFPAAAARVDLVEVADIEGPDDCVCTMAPGSPG